jgi:hypothetical protein
MLPGYHTIVFSYDKEGHSTIEKKVQLEAGKCYRAERKTDSYSNYRTGTGGSMVFVSWRLSFYEGDCKKYADEQSKW